MAISWATKIGNRANPQLVPVEGTATGLDLTAAGGASSGEDGADVFTVLASMSSPRRLHILSVAMNNCTAGAVVTVRMYMRRKSTDTVLTKFYEVSFTKDSDPDLIAAIDGCLAIMSNMRLEMHSDNMADNNVDVDYSYIRE